MTLGELRAVGFEVNEGSQDAAKVPSHSLHRKSNASLRRATDVVAVPGHALRDVGVNSGCEEKGPCVLDAGGVRPVKNGQADDAYQVEADHYDTPSLDPIGYESCCETKATGNNIWWNRQQLGLVVSIAKVLDDGWEEKRKRVDRREGTRNPPSAKIVQRGLVTRRDIPEEVETVSVDLPVFESLPNILAVEFVRE